MAVIKGQPYTVRYIAWDTSTSPWSRKTGDAANHTVYVDIDGGASSAITVTITEIDSVNRPGEYKFLLSGTYTNGDSIGISIKSSTANVFIQPMMLLTEQGRIDAAISTRATPADIANTPVTLTGAEHDAIVGDVQTGLTGLGYTTARAPKLDYLDTSVSGRASQTTADAIKAQTDKMTFTGSNINADVKVMSTNATVGGYAVGQSPAEQVLATPANKLTTDTSGRVTVGDYAPTKSPGEQVLITPANKLATDTTGRVTAASVASDVNINMSQSLPATPTADTTGDALKRASTNLNAQVSSRAAPGDAMTLTAGERSSIAQAIMDYVVESTQTVSYTVLNVLRIIASALAGKVSGAQTNTPVFRNIVDTKNRITMTTDNDGNRTSVTLDGN